MVGIIGESGSGKTTFINILMGLLECKLKELRINNHKTKNFRYWQKKIGYVPQDIYLLDDTIMNNVSFDSNVNKKKLENAIANAGLKTFTFKGKKYTTKLKKDTKNYWLNLNKINKHSIEYEKYIKIKTN